MDDTDITLDDLPDELVKAGLKWLAVFWDQSRRGASTGNTRLIIEEQPDGAVDFDVTAGQVGHERVTPDE